MFFIFNGILRQAADNRRSVRIEATTLQDALAELTSRFPNMRRLLLDNSGKLRQAHRLSLNGQILDLSENTLTLSEEDHIEFFTAIAGG
ncbi:MoaD/ThiS family protein [Streptomyces nogalater]|uniref:MoaD/ThiS family protein n=1 Tax=Streptomyces nogalater TaxID=38314 RepID=A0ABW0WP54_STRNO